MNIPFRLFFEVNFRIKTLLRITFELMHVGLFIIYHTCTCWMFHCVINLVRYVGFMQSMCFSLPILYHQERIYFPRVCDPCLSHDKDQPTYLYGQFVEDLLIHLCVLSSLISSHVSFFYRLRFNFFAGARVA